jgi:hypothetical protein
LAYFPFFENGYLCQPVNQIAHPKKGAVQAMSGNRSKNNSFLNIENLGELAKLDSLICMRKTGCSTSVLFWQLGYGSCVWTTKSLVVSSVGDAKLLFQGATRSGKLSRSSLFRTPSSALRAPCESPALTDADASHLRICQCQVCLTLW